MLAFIAGCVCVCECATIVVCDSLKLAELLIEEHHFQWFSSIVGMMFLSTIVDIGSQPTDQKNEFIPFSQKWAQDKEVLFPLKYTLIHWVVHLLRANRPIRFRRHCLAASFCWSHSSRHFFPLLFCQQIGYYGNFTWAHERMDFVWMRTANVNRYTLTPSSYCCLPFKLDCCECHISANHLKWALTVEWLLVDAKIARFYKLLIGLLFNSTYNSILLMPFERRY